MTEAIATARRAHAKQLVAELNLNPLGRAVQRTFVVDDPATGEVIAEVPDFGPADGVAALDEMEDARSRWASTTPGHRASILDRAHALLAARREDLAHIITYEMGKPLYEALGEVDYAAGYVRWFAGEAIRPQGSFAVEPGGASDIAVTRAPVGNTLLITPWNFPMAMITRKLAPALAAGCTVLIKPAELTPLTTLATVAAFFEAGVPQDVIKVVTTSDAPSLSARVMSDPRLRKVSFTGSTPVGSVLLQQAAANVMRSSMELGGNAPLLVLADANIDRAVRGTITAKLRNGGQSCVAVNRILVDETVADEYVDRLVSELSRAGVGDGFGEDVQLGPVIDARARTKLLEMTQNAIERGATLRLGGHSPQDNGYFFAPTVLDHVPDAARITTEEIFGPIAAISRFSSTEEAIQRANSTPFGLAGYVFSEGLDQARMVADALEVGMVGINHGLVSNIAAPFGGLKQSGLGREGGVEGLAEFQETKFFNIAR